MKLTLAVLLLSAAAFAQQSKNPVTDVLRDSLVGRQKNTVAAIDIVSNQLRFALIGRRSRLA